MLKKFQSSATLIKASNYIAPETLTPQGKESYIDYHKLSVQYNLKDTQILAAFIKGSQRVTDLKLAELVGVSRQTIYNWKQNPNYVNLTNNIALLSLKGMFSDAVFNMQDLMASTDEKVKFNATRYTMDKVIEIEAQLTAPAADDGDAIDALVDILKNPESLKRNKILGPAGADYDRVEDIYDPSELL